MSLISKYGEEQINRNKPEVFMKGLYVNGREYYIYNCFLLNKKQTFRVLRVNTKEEEDILLNVMGGHLGLTEIDSCNNMRDAINTVKRDAANPITMDERYGFSKNKEYFQWYKKEIIKLIYLLRMRSDSFIMCVDKISNEYINFYAKNMPNGEKDLKEIVKEIEKHPKLEEE